MRIRIPLFFSVNILLLILIHFKLVAQFENPFLLDGGKRNFTHWQSKSPKEAAMAIANRAMAQTPFTYKLALEKPGEKFDGVRVLDFGRTFGLGKEAVAVAISEITSTGDTSITLEISHNDEVIISVNGKEVYQSLGANKFEVAVMEQGLKLTSLFEVDLKKGPNRLLIKSMTKGKEWLVYLQPKDAPLEGGKIRNLTIGISKIGGVDRSVSEISNWLICGPLSPEPQGITAAYGPEKEFKIGSVWEGINGPVSWSVLKTDPLVSATNPNPMWGTHYNFNERSASLAWTMAQLGKLTGTPSFNSYAVRYCNFMLDAAPLADYQYNTLHKYQSIHSPMVAFQTLASTTATALPYIGLLADRQTPERRTDFEQKIVTTRQYLAKNQSKLPDGTFCRDSPEPLTTSPDDLFMAIPFLIQASVALKDEKEKKDLLNQAAKQVIGIHKTCFDANKNLYHHASLSSKKSDFPFLSRANGMAIFATSQLLQNLTKSHSEFKAILKIFNTHATQLAAVQNSKTGHWHQILNDTTSQVETSGTAFILASLARGISEGWLPKAKFEKAISLGWNAIANQISPEGDVFGICLPMTPHEDPNYYKKRMTVRNASEGLTAVLWAAIEVEKMHTKK